MLIQSASPELYLPKDGKSHVNPWLAAVARPVNKALVCTLFRKNVRGSENIPDSGPDVLCPTHQSMLDPLVVATLSDRDLRYMAAKEQFIGFRGKVMSNVGAFPVDRNKPSVTTVKHSMELMARGKGLVIFGEGKIYNNDLVHPLEPGIGWIVTRTGAESVIPIAMHTRPSKAEDCGFGERAAGLLISAGITAAGIAASFGGPLVRSIVTGITGGISGAWLAGKAARGNAGDEPFGPMLKKVVWGAIGGVAGGILGAAATAFLPGMATYIGIPAGIIVGRAAFDAARSLQKRDVVDVEIGAPIKVEPYIQKHGKKDAAQYILADVHKSLCESKARLVKEAGEQQPDPGIKAVKEDLTKGNGVNNKE